MQHEMHTHTHIYIYICVCVCVCVCVCIYNCALLHVFFFVHVCFGIIKKIIKGAQYI